MNYPFPLLEATFLQRPNRFIAQVLLAGQEITVHVPNTGRCRELLQPNVKVLLSPAANKQRRTPYSLVAVYKGERLINMDSAAPNRVIQEALSQGLLQTDHFRPETTWGNSRFDFSYQKASIQGLIEVKGVTLENNNIAYFPDAPTQRGTKHIYELIRAKQQGYNSHIWFVIQMAGVACFRPNEATDPAFAKALRSASLAGVEIKAYDCNCHRQGLTLKDEIPVIL